MTSLIQPTLLSLPLEIRQIIYSFCYSEPLSDITHEWVPVSDSKSRPALRHKNKRRRLYKRDNGTVKLLRMITTKCRFPTCHLSLLTVSRQVRNEFLPIFAAHHTFSFRDPLTFANKYLSYAPPHHYSNIRHLAATWDLSKQECDCKATNGECREHSSPNCDVLRDMRNVLGLVNIYPELFSSLQSMRFDICSPLGQASNSHELEMTLFRNAILLLEKMDCVKTIADYERRKYLIVPHPEFARNWRTITMYLNILLVPDELWMLAVDGASLVDPPCDGCMRSGVGPDHRTYIRFEHECKRHLVNWQDHDEFLSALQKGWLVPNEERLATGGDDAGANVSDRKNWKVLFNTASGPRKQWEAVMEEWNARRRIVQKSKLRARKRAEID